MIRKLALFVSLSAFAGVAAADCGSGHSEKDAKAASSTVLASQAPAQANGAPASTLAGKRTPACAGASCEAVAKQPAAPVVSKGKASAEGDKVVLVGQPAR